MFSVFDLTLVAGVLTPVVFLLGGLSALDAVMNARTPQGATAWAISLISLPLLTLPLYWIFGRSTFDDYIGAMDRFEADVLPGIDRSDLEPYRMPPEDRKDLRERIEIEGFRRLATQPFTRGNRLDLLIDGEATYAALFEAIDAAEAYVFTQFYIIHDDEIGTAYQQALIRAAERGVDVRLLYDVVGSHKLPERYLDALRKAGVRTSAFGGRRRWLRRFRLNFRNHRKITVVDGRVGFVGGLNMGDEYLGRDESIGPWRDTHLRAEGPVVQGLQVSLMQDWFYSAGEAPELSWTPSPSPSDQCALVLASGPADDLETCGLLFVHAIESAEKRVWIATPYFVPDGRVLGALQLAALRGVDVRVLMPRTSDSLLFKFVPYAYFPEIERAGVKVYLYEEGFMHQKVLLVDEDYAAIGTANFDNRSFRLNFEATCLANDAKLCAEVASMLEHDLDRSTRLHRDDLTSQSKPFRLAVQGTRLLAPVL